MPILNGFKTAEQHLPQYVPLPFDAMLQAGQQLQANANTFRDTESTDYSTAGALKAVPGGADELYLKNYVQGIKDIQDKYKDMNLTDPTILSKYKSDVKNITDNVSLNNIQSTYDNLVSASKEYRDLMKAGKGNNILYNIMLDKYKSSTPNEIGDYSVPEYNHYRDKTETYFNNLKEHNLGYITAPDNSLTPINGIGEKQINDVVNDNLYEYMTSPEFQNEYNIETYGQDVDKMDEDAKGETYTAKDGSTKHFLNYAEYLSYNQLMSAGREKLTDTSGKLTNSGGNSGKGFTYNADGSVYSPLPDNAGDELFHVMNEHVNATGELASAVLGNSDSEYTKGSNPDNPYGVDYVPLNTNNISTGFVAPTSFNGAVDMGKQMFINQINEFKKESSDLNKSRQNVYDAIQKQFPDKYTLVDHNVLSDIVKGGLSAMWGRNVQTPELESIIDKKTGKPLSDDYINSFIKNYNADKIKQIKDDAAANGITIKDEDLLGTPDLATQLAQTLGDGQFGGVKFSPGTISNVMVNTPDGYVDKPYMTGTLLLGEGDYTNLLKKLGYDSSYITVGGTISDDFEDQDVYKQYFTHKVDNKGKQYWEVKYNVPVDISDDKLNNANKSLVEHGANALTQTQNDIWNANRAKTKYISSVTNWSADTLTKLMSNSPTDAATIKQLANDNRVAFSQEDMNNINKGVITQQMLNNLYTNRSSNPAADTFLNKLSIVEGSSLQPLAPTYHMKDNSVKNLVSKSTALSLASLPNEYQGLTFSDVYRDKDATYGKADSLHKSGNAVDISAGSSGTETNEDFFKWITSDTKAVQDWIAANGVEWYWETGSTNNGKTRGNSDHMHIEFNH